jgi:hypothetical protein
VLGAAVAAWPAVALVLSYELLMVIIPGAKVPEEVPDIPADAPLVRSYGWFGRRISS